MRPTALTKTRIALSMVMATATLATSGVAASLAPVSYTHLTLPTSDLV